MFRIVVLLSAMLPLLTFNTAQGEETVGKPGAEKEAAVSDPRQLVNIPEQSRLYLRDDMLEHMTALNQIIGYLAVNDFDAAAEVAETKMGKSSMGKHRATGMGPGRFMPLAMGNIG
jgi:hypothetical protein